MKINATTTIYGNYRPGYHSEMGGAAFDKCRRSREHRERVQPASRARLGFLEKKKDYLERANDHHRKRDHLKALKIRASARNPDEFYFGMINSRQVHGQHLQDAVKQNQKQPSKDALGLMKSQDLGYISLQIKRNQRKLDRLLEELAVSQSFAKSNQASHVFFADSDGEAEQIVSKHSDSVNDVSDSPVDDFMDDSAIEDDLESDDDTENDIESEDESEEESEDDNGDEVESENDSGDEEHDEEDDTDALNELDLIEEVHGSQKDRHLEKLRAEIKVRQDRINTLTAVERKLKLDRQLLQKGRRRMIGVDSTGFSIYKWAPERKR